MWQHRYIHLIAVLVSFVLPTVLGALWNGWVGALGGFLISGVARVVVLQHGTFLINSACHTFGRQPYSTRCSARDSFFMALFTLRRRLPQFSSRISARLSQWREPWNWDPTKWMIWTLCKLGLVESLRRVPNETIEAGRAPLRSQLIAAHADETQSPALG